MKVVLPDGLARLRAGSPGKTKFPIPVIKSFRDKLVVLEAAPDERTLRNLRSLRYEKLIGDREGQRSIRLNDQWRLTFRLEETTTTPTIFVLGIEDYH